MATALVVAAGSGERLRAGSPKALVDLAGRPMLAWSLRALAQAESIDRAVVAAPPDFETRVEVVAVEAAPSLALAVLTGGESRSESVSRALAAAEGSEVVAVHDAARPLASASLFDRCVAELDRIGCDAVVAAAPAADTIKRVGSDGQVSETLDRATLWSVQTPQVFRFEALHRALASATDLATATDDAMLVEQTGGDVRVVEAPAYNIKVTVASDLKFAAFLLADAD